MASFAVSSYFGALLASVGLEVSGLGNTDTNDESKRVCRVVLPCTGKDAKRLFSRLFHACYIYTHEACDCCPGYYRRAKVEHARENVRCVLGVLDDAPDTIRTMWA